jgi:hypothetical protein
MVNGNNQTPFGSEGFTDWLAGGGWGNLLLSQMPQAAYYSAQPGLEFAQASPRQGRYFQQAYQDIFSDFLGGVGTGIRTGQEPASFQEFLETNPWTSRYGRLPQTARGTTGLAANPRTRFLFNY